MKNWKKLAALGMTVLMTAGVFAGCGSSGGYCTKVVHRSL